MSNKAIIDALIALDPKDDAQWTTNGAPKIEPLALKSGVTGLTRQQIIDLAPDLTRETHATWVQAKQQAAKTVDDHGDDGVDESIVSDEWISEEELEEKRQVADREIEELEAFVRAREKDLNEIDNEIRDLNLTRAQVDDEKQKAEEELQKRKPQMTAADAIRIFTDSQHRARAERVLGAQEAAKHFGPQAAASYGGSPLDQVLRNRPSARVRARQARAKQGA